MREKAVPAGRQGFTLPLILIATIGVLIVGGLIFYILRQNSQLEAAKKAQAALNEEKVQLEKDLIFYKNTDLAKEIELSQSKLNIAERDLAQREQDLASANNRLKIIETNRGKIKSHLDAIEAVSSNYWKYTLTEPILDNIEGKIKALGDSETLSLWIVARNQTTPNSANPSAVWDVVSRILTNVRSLLP